MVYSRSSTEIGGRLFSGLGAWLMNVAVRWVYRLVVLIDLWS